LFKRSSGEHDVSAEREWGKGALDLLSNYYELEDPRRVVMEPLKREMWVQATLPVKNSDLADDEFLMRGIVDRIDQAKTWDGEAVLRIVDYKTGKAPDFKYSKAMNAKIADEAMWQLKIYALLLEQMKKGNTLEDFPMEGCIRCLRLLYLTSVSGKGQYLDFDLGHTEEKRSDVLEKTHQELSDIWTNIRVLIDKQDPTAFVGCDRTFCFCHKLRPRFAKGTVWEK